MRKPIKWRQKQERNVCPRCSWWICKGHRQDYELSSSWLVYVKMEWQIYLGDKSFNPGNNYSDEISYCSFKSVIFSFHVCSEMKLFPQVICGVTGAQEVLLSPTPLPKCPSGRYWTPTCPLRHSPGMWTYVRMATTPNMQLATYNKRHFVWIDGKALCGVNRRKRHFNSHICHLGCYSTSFVFIYHLCDLFPWIDVCYA